MNLKQLRERIKTVLDSECAEGALLDMGLSPEGARALAKSPGFRAAISLGSLNGAHPLS